MVHHMFSEIVPDVTVRVVPVQVGGSRDKDPFILTAALNGDEWSASCPRRCTIGTQHQYPLSRRLGGPQIRFRYFGEQKCVVPLKWYGKVKDREDQVTSRHVLHQMATRRHLPLRYSTLADIFSAPSAISTSLCDEITFSSATSSFLLFAASSGMRLGN